jgi:hypothetical protein
MSEASGVMASRAQNARGSGALATRAPGGVAVSPRVSADDATNATTATVRPPRNPNVAAMGPANGDPRMVPKKNPP